MGTASQMPLPDAFRQQRPVAAPEDQLAPLGKLSAILHDLTGKRRKCRLEGPGGQVIELPEHAFHALARVAEVLAAGDAVVVLPISKELTTQQAADLLNVSRQYLVRLLDEKKIPHSKTGKHRRVRLADVLAYKTERDKKRTGQLKELTAMTEELGGYDDLK
jgi:excisionase family DNA binding protein